MRPIVAVLPLTLLILAACDAPAPDADTTADPRAAAPSAAPASAAATEAHRKASTDLDAVLQSLPADAGIDQEQAAWKANLVTSCETVTPEDERLGCETRLMEARVSSLRERFAN